MPLRRMGDGRERLILSEAAVGIPYRCKRVEAKLFQQLGFYAELLLTEFRKNLDAKNAVDFNEKSPVFFDQQLIASTDFMHPKSELLL